MPGSGTRPSTIEGLLPLSRNGPDSLRTQLTSALRAAIRSGALPAGQTIPSSRSLATDLTVSRRLVVEVYEQLVAEGYLHSTPRSGTVVGNTVAADVPTPPPPPTRRIRHDLRPGIPDLTAFPVATWRRATTRAMALPPVDLLDYPDPQGWWPLRVELASYLRRVRGVDTQPDRMVICSSAVNALSLLTTALVAQRPTTVGIEEPGMIGREHVISRAGGDWQPFDIDDHGVLTTQVLNSSIDALLVSPAHQFPIGAALSLHRRSELTRWATRGGLLIEDDYDAEFRYDRAPVGALQGLIPEQVAYVGTTSKSLAPGMRLGWLALPKHLVAPVTQAKLQTDGGTSTLLQATFAQFLVNGDYDRHLRSMRRHYRRRRDALIAALDHQLPTLSVGGVAAGLHLTLSLPDITNWPTLRRALRDQGVDARCTDDFRAGPAATPMRLVLGYGNLTSASVEGAVRALSHGLKVSGVSS